MSIQAPAPPSTARPALAPLRPSFALIRENRGAYLALNLLFFGLVFLGFIVAALDPPVQKALQAALRADLDHGRLAPVADLYRSGNIPLAVLVTFLVNAVIGAFAGITLPSSLIPFSGFVVGCYRAAIWGLSLARTDPRMLLAMIPHSLTLVLEGEAYVVAMFGCYLWGKWLIRPAGAGFPNAREARRAGLRANLQLYRLILLLLAVAAVYEAIEVIGMMAMASLATRR
jgi:hypothetical protein